MKCPVCGERSKLDKFWEPAQGLDANLRKYKCLKLHNPHIFYVRGTTRNGSL